MQRGTRSAARYVEGFWDARGKADFGRAAAVQRRRRYSVCIEAAPSERRRAARSTLTIRDFERLFAVACFQLFALSIFGVFENIYFLSNQTFCA